ncbi:MAG: hypothetical protein N3B14_02595 [Thermoleophilia bacterium]|nr:hypothetical protein [Thermoleophilia bacterium]
MTLADDVFPGQDRCEICGATLGDKVHLQEFADGSVARLCAECAAGVALDPQNPPPPEDEFVWPTPPPVQDQSEIDPLEKTRELLDPVNDLIALQKQMQATLERLAASLERFALEVISETQGKSTIESRLRSLEQELAKTRALLRQTDIDLASLAGVSDVDTAPTYTEPVSTVAATSVSTPEATQDSLGAAPVFFAPEPVQGQEPEEIKLQPSPEQETTRPEGAGFTLEEVQLTQRYYNESPFVNRIRDIVSNLGKPKANLTRVPGPVPRAIVTIVWDIVWYQYLVDLRKDLPSGQQRVILHREGLDPDELAHYFKEKNAVINNDGRLDASELEVRLLSDPSVLITEMTPEEAQLLEDATEEIWDQGSPPEFRWDD